MNFWKLLTLISLVAPVTNFGQPTSPQFTAAADPKTGQLTIVKSGQAYLAFAYADWEAGWGGVTRKQTATPGDSSISFTYNNTLRKSKTPITVLGSWTQTTPEAFAFTASLTPEADTELTLATITLTAGTTFHPAHATLTHADGTTTTSPVPFPRGNLGTAVTRLALTDTAGQTATLAFNAPTSITGEGQARLILAKGKIQVGQTYPLAFTLTLPSAATFYSGPDAVPPSTTGWYEFKGQSPIPADSEWSLTSWLDAPAGKHGRITRQDDQLIYNGQPIKLWGLNISYANCAPEKELADRRADFYATLGINSVRLHKYANGKDWAGIQSKDSAAVLDPAGLDRFDYFVAALKKRGITVKLSPVFIMNIGPADLAAIPYANELGAMQRDRIDPKHGSFFVSTELQKLLLRQVTSLLKHTNPYTGLTYAEDPVVAFVEIYNEDDALFGGIPRVLAASPTLRTRIGAQFAAWLKAKYTTETAFTTAWGSQGLNNSLVTNLNLPLDESFSKGRIYPAGNPWFFDPDNLATSQAPFKQRLHDTMEFLYELQNEVYARYTAAIRATGYTGEMISSNWQSGRAMSHFYNLHSDALIGTIDRHNYFGGGRGQKFAFNSTSMLAVPGSGTLSASLQQVGNRPFMLSEWIHVQPNEWGVEGPAILGAYGMGLQGWDVSYPFQNSDDGTFATAIGLQSWHVVAPNFLGIFPAVSRQVLRGDVTESPLVHTRHVHIPSLAKGKVGFDEKVVQEHDVKTFTSDVFPAAALAVARSVVRFTDTFTPTESFDLAAHTAADGTLTSVTQQLRWHAGQSAHDGYITIDTPATQAVVGFAQGQRLQLGDAHLRLESRYAALYLSARDRDATLATGKAILVSAIARARNQGTVIADDSFLFSRGNMARNRPTGPVVMEPVVATIQLTRPGTPTVHLLDHNGVKTGKTLPVTNGALKIDTGRDATPYYLIEYR